MPKLSKENSKIKEIRMKSFFALLLLSFSSVFAQTNYDFDSLYSSEDLSASIGAYGNDIPEKKYGVSYSLKGIIKISENSVFFYTSDGRVFKLDMKVSKAREYENKPVQIYAKALQADMLDTLKPEEINFYDPSNEVQLPKYLPKRKQPVLISSNGSIFQIQNIRWHSQPPSENSFDWRDVSIDVSKIKNIYFVKKPFPPESIAAHSLMLFTFEKGGVIDSNGNETDSIVLSIEAFLREGQEYSLMEGMKDKFNIVWILATWKDYSERMVYFDKDSKKLVLYPVKLANEAKKELLSYSLSQSAVNREGEYYNTITNNCTNNLVILINKTLPEEKKIRLWDIPYLVYNLRATMPVWVPQYLQKKDILGPEYRTVTAENFQEKID